jgi:alcohol dehydrogenase
MKAARLYQQGAALQIEEIDSAFLPPGGVRVRVLSTHLLSFTQKLLSGQLPVPLPTPYTPGTGAIGIIEETADDVNGIEVGTRVFCSPYLTSVINGNTPESILIGWFGYTPGSAGLLANWKNGSFAEQAAFPVQCVTLIDQDIIVDSERLAALNYLSIAYGGWLKGGLVPGQTVIICGATGNLGTAAVLTALAMGASTIGVLGRDQRVLEHLITLSPERIVAIPVGSDPKRCQAHIKAEIGQVDLILDALGNVLTPELTTTCIQALRPGGTAVLIGGVFAELPISYYQVLAKELTIRGSFMYPNSAPGDLLRMIKAGTLNIGAIRPHIFRLDEIDRAMNEATGLKGTDYCIVTP